MLGPRILTRSIWSCNTALTQRRLNHAQHAGHWAKLRISCGCSKKVHVSASHFVEFQCNNIPFFLANSVVSPWTCVTPSSSWGLKVRVLPRGDPALVCFTGPTVSTLQNCESRTSTGTGVRSLLGQTWQPHHPKINLTCHHERRYTLPSIPPPSARREQAIPCRTASSPDTNSADISPKMPWKMSRKICQNILPKSYRYISSKILQKTLKYLFLTAASLHNTK